MSLSVSDWLIGIIGNVLLVGLVFRGIATRSWGPFWLFFTYLLVATARSILITRPLAATIPIDYAVLYWRSADIVSPLRLLVCWEVFRHLFPRGTVLRRTAGSILVLALVLFAVYVVLRTDPIDTTPERERLVSIIVCVWLGVVLACSYYYSMPFSRPAWGMAVGLGLYVSLSLVNFSALDLLKEFAPVWRIVRPLSFVLMILIWHWALWSYEPETPSPDMPGKVSKSSFLQWQARWSSLRAGIKKAVGF